MMPIVHLVRHGRIPDYETDRPLTEAGMEEAFAVGQTLAARLRPGETVRFFSSPARRARQTAALLRDGLTGALARSGQTATVTPIVEVDDRLQNLQFLLDGLSYDPIHPLFEVIRHRQAQTPSPHYRACADFHAGFWNSPDPMAYWLTHPSPAIEPPEAVAGRIRDYVAALLESA
ncbi:MAG: phosphoglycerate mutase family protein, partial [Anaerolineae bacterium]